jgi:hypothetical protein
VTLDSGVLLKVGKRQLALELDELDAGRTTYLDVDFLLLFGGVAFPAGLEIVTEGALD